MVFTINAMSMYGAYDGFIGMVILVPGVVTVACTYFIEPIFAPYMSEE